MQEQSKNTQGSINPSPTLITRLHTAQKVMCFSLRHVLIFQVIVNCVQHKITSNCYAILCLQIYLKHHKLRPFPEINKAVSQRETCSVLVQACVLNTLYLGFILLLFFIYTETTSSIHPVADALKAKGKVALSAARVRQYHSLDESKLLPHFRRGLLDI